MPRTLLLCLAVFLGLFCSSASAAPFPMTGLTPAPGSYPTSQSPLTFEFRSEQGLTLVSVEVASQNIQGQDGTLANDYMVGFGQFFARDSDPAQYRGTVNGTYYFSPSTVYFQFQGSPTGCGANTECRYLSPVYTYTFGQPTPAPATPAPAPTPSPAPAPQPTPAPTPRPQSSEAPTVQTSYYTAALSKTNVVRFGVECSAPNCTVDIAGEIEVRGKAFEVNATRLLRTAGKEYLVSIKLSRKAATAVRSAVRKRRYPAVRLGVVGTTDVSQESSDTSDISWRVRRIAR